MSVKKRQPRPVMSWLPSSERTTLKIMAHVIVEKLAAGLFDEVDDNTLAYLLNVSLYLALGNGNEEIVQSAEACLDAVREIRQRKGRVGKWGAAQDELAALQLGIDACVSYFADQPVHRIAAARIRVLAVNEKMKQREEGL